MFHGWLPSFAALTAYMLSDDNSSARCDRSQPLHRIYDNEGGDGRRALARRVARPAAKKPTARALRVRTHQRATAVLPSAYSSAAASSRFKTSFMTSMRAYHLRLAPMTFHGAYAVEVSSN